jgi:putative ABC transport system permease protein
VLGRTVRVEPGDLTVRIVGVARESAFSGNPVLYVTPGTLAAARQAANPDAGEALPTALAVKLAPGASPAAVAAAISKQVDGVEGYTKAGAEEANPGVSAVTSSFSVILALFYVVVPLVAGLFFLILTLQKANSLTLLRALGAPRMLLVRNLLGQVVGVVVTGVAIATLLLWGAAQGANRLGISVEAGPVLTTGGVILALALAASVAAIRRVLAIDPILATTGPEVRA